jgi:hypothetical protein
MGKDMRIFLKGKKQREMGGWNSPGTKTTQKNKKNGWLRYRFFFLVTGF